MPRFILSTVMALLAAWPLQAQQQHLELDLLIDEALANNPSLSALEARWKADEARIPQAGALMDPMVKFELSNVPLSDFDFDSTPMSGKQLMVSQQLPYWGKRATRERIALHMASVSEQMYLDREGIIINMVKQAYYSLAFLDHAIAITKKNEALLGDFVRIAETKYAVGKGLQQDVLKAQVTLSGLRDKLIDLRRLRGQAEARLNTVLNRLPQQPTGTVAPLKHTPFIYDVEGLQQMALELRPQLKAIEENIQRWKAAEDLARLDYKPDFAVNLGYRQRSFDRDPVEGSDFVSLGVAFNLPIYRGRKQAQQVREAQQRAEMSKEQYEMTKQQIFLEVQNLYLDVQAHEEEAALFKTAIIPQAGQALNSAMAAYQVDKVDFLTLLNNQVTLFNFEIAHFRHQIEYEKSLAELEALIGKRLF